MRGTVARHARRRPRLDLRGCTSGVTIAGGDRTFRTAEGRETGIDLDQLVWRSDAGGSRPSATQDLSWATNRRPRGCRVLSQDDATVQVRVEGADPGSPFWLVLGQSHSPRLAFESGDAT